MFHSTYVSHSRHFSQQEEASSKYLVLITLHASYTLQVMFIYKKPPQKCLFIMSLVALKDCNRDFRWKLMVMALSAQHGYRKNSSCWRSEAVIYIRFSCLNNISTPQQRLSLSYRSLQHRRQNRHQGHAGDVLCISVINLLAWSGTC